MVGFSVSCVKCSCSANTVSHSCSYVPASSHIEHYKVYKYPNKANRQDGNASNNLWWSSAPDAITMQDIYLGFILILFGFSHRIVNCMTRLARPEEKDQQQ